MYTPVPMKRNMHYGSDFWIGYSHKIGRKVQFYSSLEYDNWMFIETDPEIVTFCEQPLRIEYKIDGKTYESIFDMYVKRRDGSEGFIEVKYTTDLNPKSKKYERTIRQLTIQEEWCRENNFNHYIHTEKTIRGNKVLLENKRLMKPYFQSFRNCTESEFEIILYKLKYRKKAVGELLEEINELSPDKLYLNLFFMIYSGKIKANLDEVPISLKLEVWSNG